MLIIFCAELEEAKNIKCPNAKIVITGAGLSNVIQTPIFKVNSNDHLINIGYAGSNLYPIGTVCSVKKCRRLTPSLTINESELELNSLLTGVCCYTADSFIEHARDEIPLVDMELYYLASIYPQIQSLKIVSDNLDFNEYKKAVFEQSWNTVNEILNNLER